MKGSKSLSKINNDDFDFKNQTREVEVHYKKNSLAF
jgi:hypothetical protein